MNILIVGDSNTFGYAVGIGRLPAEDRWPNRLQKAYPEIDIQVDAVSGRHYEGAHFGLGSPLDGKRIIESKLKQYKEGPDALIIQLAANDLTGSIGVQVLVDMLVKDLAEYAEQTPVLLILPSIDDNDVWRKEYGAPWLKNACDAYNNIMTSIDFGPRITLLESDDCSLSPLDGVHLTAAGNHRMAEKVAHALTEMGVLPHV